MRGDMPCENCEQGLSSCCLRPCPECAQGKCGNCTFEALDENDNLTHCPCMIAGHKGAT